MAVKSGRPLAYVRLLTVSEVAFLLHVHANTVRKWSDRGLLPAARLGKRGDRRFSWEDVQGILRKVANST